MKGFLRFLRLVGLPLLVAVGIYSFIRFVWIGNTKKEFSFVEITSEQYSEIYVEQEECVVFITKDDFENKRDYEKIIKESFDGKQITVYYYNITDLTDKELVDFEVTTELDVKKGYELPMLVYILKGQVYDFMQGYQATHYVRDFIERNNIG